MKNRYSDKELHEAFDLVKNKKDWKMPVNAVIDPSKRDVVHEAVIYFTGSIPHFSKAAKGMVRVRAEGYYNAMVF